MNNWLVKYLFPTLMFRMADGDGGDGGDGGGEGGGDTSPWTTGLDESQAAFVANKGWSSPTDIVRGYQELESLRGVPADRLLKLPDPSSENPDDWTPIYTALGRPENVDGYQIELPEGTAMHEGRQKAFAEKAFEIGLNAKQVQALASWDAEFTTGIMQESESTLQARAQDAINDLRKEWGAGFDRQVGNMDRAQAMVGITGEEIAAMDTSLGRKRTMELLANIGAKVGEDALDDVRGGGDKGFNGMTPAEAETQLAQLRMDDSFMAKYKAGNPDALARWDGLMRAKHGG